MVYKENIRRIYEELSPAYRRVADFVLNHYQDAAFMTATEVAQAADVDTALVVRFAQRLGYRGFPDLLEDIKADVKRDLKKTYLPFPEESSPEAIFQRTLIQDRNNLEYVLSHVDMGIVRTVIEILQKAERILVAGEGTAFQLAESFVTRLLMIGRNGHSIPSELSTQVGIAAGIRPSDAFIGLAATIVNPSVTAILKVARAEGAYTIGIVGSLDNPVAGVAEYVIHAPATSSGIMPSWTAIAAVLHALFQGLAISLGEATAEWILRSDLLLRNYITALRGQIPAARAALATFNLPPEGTLQGET